MDLAGIFTLLFVAAGIILLADWAVFKRHRPRGADGVIVGEPLLVQYARSFFPVILVVLLIRAFVFEPFRIPSASMMPGLVAGDFISGNTIGALSSPGADSLDTFRIKTAALPPAIYRHRLMLTTKGGAGPISVDPESCQFLLCVYVSPMPTGTGLDPDASTHQADQRR